jgi:UDP-N-acetylglucosamine:LPS N-acetylglucosamine transferase
MLTMAKIAIFTGPQGHLSLAQSAEAALQDQHQVSLFFDRNILFSLYTPIYQFLPGVHQIPFELSKAKRYHSTFYDLFKFQYGKKIKVFFDQIKPDVLISTHFMFNPSLGELSKEFGVPFINILPDPRTMHPLFISDEADYNLAFDDKATLACNQEKESEISCITTGWFIRPEFEETYNQKQVRRQLGLDPDLLTLLISSGSEGTTMVMKLLPFLAQLTQPIQLVVACGSNTTLLKGVTGLRTVLSKVNGHSKVVPLSFVTNMHHYMQAADLVIGKAGPNSLFESVATHTPFFAITHISGQEDGNLDIIREYNLGYVEENTFKAQELLQSIINDPQQLEAFKPSLKKLANHNKQSKQKLLKLVNTLTGKK